jgi:hypothetical protein
MLKEMLAAQNEMSGIAQTVKDEPSADAALPKLDKLASRVGDLNEKLGKLPESDLKKLAEKNLTEMAESGDRLWTLLKKAGAAAPAKAAQFDEIIKKTGMPVQKFEPIGKPLGPPKR